MACMYCTYIVQTGHLTYGCLFVVAEFSHPRDSLLVEARQPQGGGLLALSPSVGEVDLQAAIFKPEVHIRTAVSKIPIEHGFQRKRKLSLCQEMFYSLFIQFITLLFKISVLNILHLCSR